MSIKPAEYPFWLRVVIVITLAIFSVNVFFFLGPLVWFATTVTITANDVASGSAGFSRPSSAGQRRVGGRSAKGAFPARPTVLLSKRAGGSSVHPHAIGYFKQPYAVDVREP
jgi:hypothetical protein